MVETGSSDPLILDSYQGRNRSGHSEAFFYAPEPAMSLLRMLKAVDIAVAIGRMDATVPSAIAASTRAYSTRSWPESFRSRFFKIIRHCITFSCALDTRIDDNS